MRFLSIVLLLIAVLAYPARSVMKVDRRQLVADGRSTAHVRVVAENLVGWPALDLFPRAPSWSVRAAEELGLKVMVAHDRSIVFRAGTRAGSLPIVLDETIELRFTVEVADLDEDGFPDSAELISREDRAAFVAWFTAIAEAQATNIDDAWTPIHHDCAGLVRYAYKEALREHSAAWREKRRVRLPRAPDVAALRYPDLPIIGDQIFRAKSGSFDPGLPISEQFTAAATAPILYAHNTAFISRELEEARSGDLLFYNVPDGTGSRMHTMIVLGDGLNARVVYHTGLDGEAGEVRLVTAEQLAQHPDAGWHPVAHNPRFLGVHRLALLEHDAKMFGALR